MTRRITPRLWAAAVACAAACMPLLAAATNTAWPQDTDLVMSGPAITLKIVAGSEAESLVVTPTTFTVDVASGDVFTISYPGNPSGTLPNDGGFAACNHNYTSNNVAVVGPKTVTFTPSGALTCAPVFGGGGGGGGGGGVSGGSSGPIFFQTAEAPAAPDSTLSGPYNATAAMNATATINIDKGLVAPASPPACGGGTLIKGSTDAVYYCGHDGKRYVFPNEKVYYSWYDDFSLLVGVSDETLASIPIGGNVTSRPGKRMVKIQTDPKVYAVSRRGTLRWVKTEALALAIYGTDWNKMIDDVPDAFFVNYAVGEPIEAAN